MGHNLAIEGTSLKKRILRKGSSTERDGMFLRNRLSDVRLIRRAPDTMVESDLPSSTIVCYPLSEPLLRVHCQQLQLIIWDSYLKIPNWRFPNWETTSTDSRESNYFSMMTSALDEGLSLTRSFQLSVMSRLMSLDLLAIVHIGRNIIGATKLNSMNLLT